MNNKARIGHRSDFFLQKCNKFFFRNTVNIADEFGIVNSSSITNKTKDSKGHSGS